LELLPAVALVSIVALSLSYPVADLDLRLTITMAVAAIAVVSASSASGGWLCSAPMRWLGTRSYGLYLWHWPLIPLLPRPAVLVASVIMAEVSFRVIEQPFRHRLSSQAVSVRDRELAVG
jgi:peptidoglycan/LPS O-acetylase OafA/YrhL